MNEDLIDDERLSLARKSLLPGTGFFYPDSLDEEYADRQVQEAVEGAEIVVVADADADGLGCVALVRAVEDAALDVAAFEMDIEARLTEAASEASTTGDVDGADGETTEGEAEDTDRSSVALVPAGPHNMEDALSRVAEFAEPAVDVFVCDLCPDRFEYVAAALDELTNDERTVRWFDHHQWDADVARAVRETGVDLVIGDSEEECTTDVALRSLDYDFPDYLHDLAAVTRDHDLWLREDSRSDDLADYAYWTDPEEYVTVVGRYGPDLPEPVESYVEHRRVEKQALIERAVERAEIKQVGPWTVGVTYGRCSQNEVAEALRERGTDAAVIVKPAGSASIRGTDAFARCHEVAAQVNGGGHPKAAGCKPDIYDDMLDYAHHWTTQGEAAKEVILAGFRRLADEEAEKETEGDQSESDEASTDE
ncbi:MAG: DHH family phosphoesterase [Halobacteriota archaeon]